MVYDVDLIDKKGIFFTLLSVNTDMLFMPGQICSLHKHGMCMVIYKDEEVDVEEPMVNDMSVLYNVLKSKTVTRASFSPEEGKIIVLKPFKWYPTIPRIRNEKYLTEVEKSLRNMKTLKKVKDGGKWKDRRGQNHTVARFTVDNIIFGDAIRRLEASESLQLRTGADLTMTNVKTTEKTIYEDINSAKARIYLSKDGRGLLLNALSGEESTITVANRVLMFVENDINMTLAGRIPE